MEIGLNEFVEIPAARMEIAHELRIHPHKDGICLYRKDDLDLCVGFQTICESACCAIGMLAVS